jgi:hypothetical protein
VIFVRAHTSGYSLVLRLGAGGELQLANVRQGFPLLTRELSLLYCGGSEWYEFATECQPRVVEVPRLAGVRVLGLHTLRAGFEQLVLLECLNQAADSHELYLFSPEFKYLCMAQVEARLRVYRVKVTEGGTVLVSCYRAEAGRVQARLLFYMAQQVSAEQFMLKEYESKDFPDLVGCIDEVSKYRLLVTSGCHFYFLDTSSCKMERCYRLA